MCSIHGKIQHLSHHLEGVVLQGGLCWEVTGRAAPSLSSAPQSIPSWTLPEPPQMLKTASPGPPLSPRDAHPPCMACPGGRNPRHRFAQPRSWLTAIWVRHVRDLNMRSTVGWRAGSQQAQLLRLQTPCPVGRGSIEGPGARPPLPWPKSSSVGFSTCNEI